MFALCSNWCLWYSWSSACIWLQWISVKNTVESYLCVFYIRHDLLSYILTEFKLTILPFVLVLSQEVCSSSWSPFFSQLRNTVWYTLSSWNEKQNIVILLTTVFTNKSSVLKIGKSGKAGYHNHFTWLKFNPKSFMHNYLYFRQIYQEC